MDGTLPRRNIESFGGNAQFGDRNKGMIDWQLVFQQERQREAELRAKRGVGALKPPIQEISEYDMVPTISLLTRSSTVDTS